MSLPDHKLVAWQRADDLYIAVHRLTHQRFPPEERFELGRQLRRAAYSVPANIVEGSARRHARDGLNFFNIVSSSLAEVGYGLPAAKRLGYIDEGTSDELEALIKTVAAPLNGLMRRYLIGRVLDGVLTVSATALLFTTIV